MRGDLTIHDSCKGYCQDCGCVHSLPAGNSQLHAKALMDEFKRIRRLDYTVSKDEADPLLSFDNLFRGDRGHMFGVLECLDAAGNTIVLRAFSSLHGGIRHIDGWVPPILNSNTWNERVLPTQTRIKELTREMKAYPHDSDTHKKLFEERRSISRALMFELQESLYFSNFRGDRRNLKKAHDGSKSLTGGIGDCCGPKLLNYAVLNKLKPLGLSEFYWGAPSPDGTKVQGHFYPCCAEKCQPILGFMLCGLNA